MTFKANYSVNKQYICLTFYFPFFSFISISFLVFTFPWISVKLKAKHVIYARRYNKKDNIEYLASNSPSPCRLTYRRSRSKAPLFLNLGARCMKVANFMFRASPAWKRTGYLLNRKLRVPHSCSGRFGKQKFHALFGIQTPNRPARSVVTTLTALLRPLILNISKD